jgi:hypothetical protein
MPPPPPPPPPLPLPVLMPPALPLPLLVTPVLTLVFRPSNPVRVSRILSLSLPVFSLSLL